MDAERPQRLAVRARSPGWFASPGVLRPGRSRATRRSRTTAATTSSTRWWRTAGSTRARADTLKAQKITSDRRRPRRSTRRVDSEYFVDYAKRELIEALRRRGGVRRRAPRRRPRSTSACSGGRGRRGRAPARRPRIRRRRWSRSTRGRARSWPWSAADNFNRSQVNLRRPADGGVGPSGRLGVQAVHARRGDGRRATT